MIVLLFHNAMEVRLISVFLPGKRPLINNGNHTRGNTLFFDKIVIFEHFCIKMVNLGFKKTSFMFSTVFSIAKRLASTSRSSHRNGQLRCSGFSYRIKKDLIYKYKLRFGYSTNSLLQKAA